MKPKEIPGWIITIIVFIVLTGCQSGTDDSRKLVAAKDSVAKIDSDEIIVDNFLKKESKNKPEIVDSGQVWFRVNVTKNDTPYLNYEGDWPLLLSSNNSSTIQLAASKKLMSISNMLTIYMYGLPSGKMPVNISCRDEKNVCMVMSQVIKDRYDIPILPGEGFLNITKNTGKILSGNFETTAIDTDKNNFLLTGTFLNVGVNDDKNIK